MSTSSKGEEARQRLLGTAQRLFACQGYSATSTRELADAAQVNVAAISYYFGDKAGLYRAAFFGPQQSTGFGSTAFADPALSLAQALRRFYGGFVEPLAQGEEVRLCLKLHFREMIEPTGLWQEEITQVIAPMHEALVQLLARHLALPGGEGARRDARLQRLAICLAGMAINLHVGHEVNDSLAPGLAAGPAALGDWTDFLVGVGLALVKAEAAERRREGAR